MQDQQAILVRFCQTGEILSIGFFRWLLPKLTLLGDNYVNPTARPETWQLLKTTRNAAAVDVLAFSLESKSEAVRTACLQSLLERPEPEAIAAIVGAFESLSQEDISRLASHAQKFPAVVSNLLKAGSLKIKRAALQCVSQLDLTACMLQVLVIAVDRRHALQAQANECITTLCKAWGQRARQGQDVPSVRTPMLDRMHSCLFDFDKHKNMELVEAWLSLVHWDDSLQRGLLCDPGHPAFLTVRRSLTESNDPMIQELLAGYLLRTTTPKSVLQILAERPQAELALVMAKWDAPTIQIACRRLHEVPPLKCLEAINLMPTVSGDVQQNLYLLTAASSHDFRSVLEGALKMAKSATKEGRQIAAEMIRLCHTPSLEAMVAEIQKAESGMIKEQSYGSQLIELSKWVTSPSSLLQDAAKKLFHEFTLATLLEYIQHWPTPMCKAMAKIVLVNQPDSADVLCRELQNPAPKRRLAALQATQLLDLSDSVCSRMLTLLDDPRLEVRVRVIDLLSALGHEVVIEMIPALLADANTDIQDAANRVLRRINRKQANLDN